MMIVGWSWAAENLVTRLIGGHFGMRIVVLDDRGHNLFCGDHEKTPIDRALIPAYLL